MAIRDVIAGSSHFHALAEVPVLEKGTSLRDAFSALRRCNALFILLAEEDESFRFIFLKDLTDAAADGSMEIRLVDLACAREAPVVAALSMDQPETSIAGAFMGPRVPVPAIIFENGRAVGVWTQFEDDDARLFTPAPIYYCKKNNHPNRAPRPRQCRMTGCGSDVR
jgi:hypothetical protein